MYMNEKDKLRKFQEFIDYEFKNEELLLESLTTPQLGNEIEKTSYEFLETLGDAVIKVIFILKLYRRGIIDPGEITKVKAALESDKNLKKVAESINLHDFIFKTEKQLVMGTRIMADVFEAICGAIFLDSNYDFKLVEEKMINPFYEDFDAIIGSSVVSEKNELLEFLQKKFKTSIIIKLKYVKSGPDHDLTWIAKNPKILGQENQKELIKIPKRIESARFSNKKDVDKDIYTKILKYLEKKNN